MLSFLIDNGGTILVLAVLVVVVGGIVLSMRRTQKGGKDDCSRGCAGCPSKGICHAEK